MSKSPLPFLTVLAAGLGLMVLGTPKKTELPDEDDIPTSIDYEDNDLKDALTRGQDGQSDEQD